MCFCVRCILQHLAVYACSGISLLCEAPIYDEDLKKEVEMEKEVFFHTPLLHLSGVNHLLDLGVDSDHPLIQVLNDFRFSVSLLGRF